MEGLCNCYIMVIKLRLAIKLVLELLAMSKDDEEKHTLTLIHNELMDILLRKEKHL